MKKIGIVASGGGMSCAYSSGVMLALIDKYNFVNPYIVIGGSGSTGTLSYYVAKQYKEGKNIWENLLSTNKFISFTRLSRIMDIDYLVDEVFRKQEPLDVEAINNSPIKFYIAATDLGTGKIKYFSNKDGVDNFELLRASSAIPIAFNKSVNIQGREYVDGALGNPFYLHIQKAVEEGAEVVIGIDNTKRNYFGHLLIKMWSLFQSKSFREGFKFYSVEYVDSKVKTIFVRPSTPLPITSTLDNDRDHILKAMEIGYNDLINNQEIRSLLTTE